MTQANGKKLVFNDSKVWAEYYAQKSLLEMDLHGRKIDYDKLWDSVIEKVYPDQVEKETRIMTRNGVLERNREARAAKKNVFKTTTPPEKNEGPVNILPVYKPQYIQGSLGF